MSGPNETKKIVEAADFLLANISKIFNLLVDPEKVIDGETIHTFYPRYEEAGYEVLRAAKAWGIRTPQLDLLLRRARIEGLVVLDNEGAELSIHSLHQFEAWQRRRFGEGLSSEATEVRHRARVEQTTLTSSGLNVYPDHANKQIHEVLSDLHLLGTIIQNIKNSRTIVFRFVMHGYNVTTHEVQFASTKDEDEYKYHSAVIKKNQSDLRERLSKVVTWTSTNGIHSALMRRLTKEPEEFDFVSAVDGLELELPEIIAAVLLKANAPAPALARNEATNTGTDNKPTKPADRKALSDTDKLRLAIKCVALNPHATPTEVEKFAGFGQRYFSRSKDGPTHWKLIQGQAGRIPSGTKSVDGYVDALDLREE